MKELKILCPACRCVLAIASWVDGESQPQMNHRRTRFEFVTPPDAPEPRYTFYCPRRGCRKPRRLRQKRIIDSLAALRPDTGANI